MKKLSAISLGLVAAQLASSFLDTPLPVTFKHMTWVTFAHAEEAQAVKYTCPMHPQIIADGPGTCPICGMTLVPLAHGHDQDQSAMTGKPVISIEAETIQKMGVRTEKVRKQNLSRSLRATGIVMENERARWDMFSQVEGRVDELYFSAPGDRVKKGEIFYTLYSPELLALQSDYVAAIKGGYKDLAQSSARRMKLLGVDDGFIAALAKTRKATESVPFLIPADGILNRLEIRKGHYLKVNDEIGHIQDLSSVWVEAALPEKDLGHIKEGDTARVTFTGNPQDYEGKVDYIYPTINAEARTGKVRLIVDNKDGMLRPASYADVSFASGEAEERLVVSTEAVLHGIEGEHVILALGDGKFQARSIKTGNRNAGQTEIVSGLEENDAIVVSAQFLIDSESSLRESFTKMSPVPAKKEGGQP